jgi:hypothetical protein
LEEENFSDLTRWTTTNSDMQYNPSQHSDPSWRPDHLDDPIAERARRRSQIAEPAGTGEFGVGGWAGIPKMRLGGSDPLGGPDRGRAGVEWGTAHFERTLGLSMVVDPSATCAPVAHRDGGAMEDSLAAVAREAWHSRNPSSAKPWEKRGLHPNRARQSPGGADVVSGLWATSSTSYGGFHDAAFKPAKDSKTKAHALRRELQKNAPVRIDAPAPNAPAEIEEILPETTRRRDQTE